MRNLGSLIQLVMCCGLVCAVFQIGEGFFIKNFVTTFLNVVLKNESLIAGCFLFITVCL